jgi:hypothetical protein
MIDMKLRRSVPLPPHSQEHLMGLIGSAGNDEITIFVKIDDF